MMADRSAGGKAAAGAESAGQLTWHTSASEDVLRRLDTPPGGLSETEAAARLRKFGRNELPRGASAVWWQVLANQFRSPLIYILLLAGAVSAAIGEVVDAGFIAGVLALNALIGGYQEWKAERSSAALQDLLKVRASVERDSEVREVDAEELVPGDIVWLESGNRLPADLRLISEHGLDVDESLLTGESSPVHKDARWKGEPEVPFADQLNMGFAGSVVIRGRGRGVVVATGTETGIGRLALDVLGSRGGKPPLLVRMERFTRVVAGVVLVAAAALGALGIFLHEFGLVDMFLFAVALAVSAIPEGLPVAMTVALAIATTRMARRQVIVRKLAAVEGLGSCTLIATDKTGTLTVNAQTIREVRLAGGERFTVTGEGFDPVGEVLFNGRPLSGPDLEPLLDLARAGALCNEADLHFRNDRWIWRGDPVDVALLTFARKLGESREALLERYPQVNEISFEPERRFAAHFHLADGHTRVFVKGAPERVLAMCDSGASETRAMETAEEMAARGYRVLAVAEGRLDSEMPEAAVPPEPSGLSFLGFVGMIDPLRPGVRDAVEECHRAGIDVIMITGDHRATALAIARELGMATREDQVAVGGDLLRTAPEDLPALMERTRVFARVAPDQKLQLVRAAREQGHFVAVTGDGVNDAPALRSAHIGIAMGKSGTDVAREASDLVIADDDFSTIVAGIEEGRVAYDNIRKVIYLLVSTGAAEIVLVTLAVVTGLPLPLLPVQLLWLNLVTNGIQDVALAFEPAEDDVLRRRPRPPGEPIFNRLMIERTLVAAVVMGVIAFGLFSGLLRAGWTESAARNLVLLLMVLFENVHIGNCRSETKSALTHSPFRSPILLGGAILALTLHVAAMSVSVGQTLLGVAPVGPEEWAGAAALALTIFVAMEAHRWTWRFRYTRRS
jgi:magnesium-transporting ATPase (P-type)